MSGLYLQQWREGGVILSRSRTKEWLLQNLIKPIDAEYGGGITFEYPYQISTPNCWIDHERCGFRVCSQSAIPGISRTLYVDFDTPAQALDFMASVELGIAGGATTEMAFEESLNANPITASQEVAIG
ncbi:hypothetical protein [Gloeobacter morelensis]|uniref:hypothetical protein n=1 Tax=Gloeobacter morelensis TaxID=2907343 RepID=UPI001E2A8F64|nr:hypothetical protein [Gloeobacter morelensis]UFP97276.1 hypothetical protein ISF26_24450 [Gloeobacter morelensis MG652769]